MKRSLFGLVSSLASIALVPSVPQATKTSGEML